jgi:ABC-type multidrug transport system fused ATPase/permease subunit
MSNGAPPTAVRTRRETKHLAIVCEPGSYAAQHADDVARHAEHALQGILELLKIPGETLLRPHRITVVAGDTILRSGGPNGTGSDGLPNDGRRVNGARGGSVDALDADPAGSMSDLTTDIVTTVYTASTPAPGLGEHLARVVVHRLTAAVPLEDRQNDATTGTAEAQRFFIDGAARYLAHQAVHGGMSEPPELAGAQRLCLETAARRKWRLPVYQAMMRGPDAVDESELYLALQEVFSAYLVGRDGIGEFLRFLAGVRRDPNHSAEIIYGKTLELLEVEWIVALRGGAGRRMVSLWEFLHRVWRYLRPYPWRQVECVALMLIGSISTQVTPYQLRNLVDLLNNDTAKADPWGYGLAQLLWILMIMVISGLLNICSVIRLVYVVNVLGQNILRDLRVAYIDRINGLPVSYFAGSRTGDLMARFTSDMSHLADPLARTTAYSLYYIILIVISFFGLIGLSWQLTLAVLLVVPAYVLISRAIGPALQRVNRGRQERLAQINSHLEEMVISHPAVLIFNLQRFMRRRTSPEIHEFRRIEIKSDFLSAVFTEASDIADLVASRVVWLAGGALVLAQFDPSMRAMVGVMTVGTVVGFSNLMGRFVTPIHRMGSIYASVAVAAASLRRIEEVLTQPPEDLDVPVGGTDEPPTLSDRLTMENIDFAYGMTPTLQDISVSIPSGSSAAFVGPTGAGKTTLVNMIPRFYEPAAGVVRIDGRDIREFSLPALRSRIALVSQDNYLFSGTVRDNIAFGKLDATDEDIVAAARAAQIHDFIMSLPAGYDSVIGERGSRFSGGQRQRLAIARALLRDAPILILDEATSALDAETEHEVLEELAAVTVGKTVISITHRLALAMRSDVIYVLDKGRIVQTGTHDELLTQPGLYRKLFEDQNESLLKAGLVPSLRMGGGSEATAGSGDAGDAPAAPTPTRV